MGPMQSMASPLKSATGETIHRSGKEMERGLTNAQNYLHVKTKSQETS